MKIEINEKEAVTLVANLLAEKMLNRVDAWKLKQRIHYEIGENLIKKIDFDKMLKEALETYKRSVGSRLGQQADRNIYDMFTNMSDRLFKMQVEIENLKEKVELLTPK